MVTVKAPGVSAPNGQHVDKKHNGTITGSNGDAVVTRLWATSLPPEKILQRLHTRSESGLERSSRALRKELGRPRETSSGCSGF
jgi:hypothetical protein